MNSFSADAPFRRVCWFFGFLLLLTIAAGGWAVVQHGSKESHAASQAAGLQREIDRTNERLRVLEAEISKLTSPESLRQRMVAFDLRLQPAREDLVIRLETDAVTYLARRRNREIALPAEAASLADLGLRFSARPTGSVP